MELDGEEGKGGGVDSFVRSIVGVDEQFFPRRFESCDVDGVSVILRGDVASTGDEGCAGDVRSSVSVLELERVGSGREGEKLMSETDTEDGELSEREGFGESGDGRDEGGGISRSVRDEETVEQLFRREEIVVVEGDDLELDATVDEAADLVELHSDVDADYSERSSRRVEKRFRRSDRFVDFGGLERDGSDESIPIGVVELDLLVALPPVLRRSPHSLFPPHQSSDHTSNLPQFLREISRIDTVDSWNTLLFQPLSERRFGEVVGEIAVRSRVRSDDETGDVDLGRFEVAGKIRVGGGRSGRDSVRSNERVSENENLSSVRRIGERLWVSDHT